MTIKPCCRKAENLVRSRPKSDLIVDKCRVCGARHFRLKADLGKMGVKLTPPKAR